jgi:hypothetical protein
MSAFLAQALLDAVRNAFQVSVGEVQYVTPEGERLWQVSAVNNQGERWIAAAPDHYDAVVLLAQMMGFELRD